MSLSKIRNITLVLALMLLAGGIGYEFGNKKVSISLNKAKSFTIIENREPPEDFENLDFSLFWEVWRRLEKNYIDRSALNSQKMIEGAIKGMVASLDDPYTSFLSPDDNKRAKEDLAGSFEGIGAQLGIKNKRIVVVAPLKGMPAEKAGLKSGDYILEVDGKETNDWTLPEAVNKIRGPKGTEVALSIIRESDVEMREIKIKRNTISVPSVETETGALLCEQIEEKQTEESKEKDNKKKTEQCKIVEVKKCPKCPKAAALRLYRFGDGTNEEWEKAVLQITEFINKVKEGKGQFKGVIFDMRDNPGGYLQGAVYVASEFLNSGVVVKQKTTDGLIESYEVNRQGRLTKVPTIVLVNNGSASASEIVAGALKDYKRAKLIGTKTFGKGSIQEAQELPEGAGLHITFAKWLMPNGGSIDKEGIEPDIIVENSNDDVTRDLQMEKAVEELLKQN